MDIFRVKNIHALKAAAVVAVVMSHYVPLTLAGDGTDKNKLVSPSILYVSLSIVAPPPIQKLASGMTL